MPAQAGPGDLILLSIFWTYWPLALSALSPARTGPQTTALIGLFIEQHEKTSVPVLAAALQIICALFHLILL